MSANVSKNVQMCAATAYQLDHMLIRRTPFPDISLYVFPCTIVNVNTDCLWPTLGCK
jgi:hypothetical protein